MAREEWFRVIAGEGRKGTSGGEHGGGFGHLSDMVWCFTKAYYLDIKSGIIL